jgi:hypothetical protein
LGQKFTHKPALEEIASGKTRVIDLELCDQRQIGASGRATPRLSKRKTNATVEKEGYFTRSFWMLEHYGTHMDAPAHFPPGTTTVDKIAPEKFFGPGGGARRHEGGRARPGLPTECEGRFRLGAEARKYSGGAQS